LQQLRPPVEIYQPVIPEFTPVAPPSRLEALYSARAGRPLTQFGYDILGVPSPSSVVQAGNVQDNYVLGEGDEIVVVLRGQENATYRQRVNRGGQVVFARLNPIPASGRTLGEFREDLESQVSQAYISTNAFVSLGEVRQISVLITGEVRAPGLRVLNALATPLDAILLSGGIAKTGSLRNVALVRQNRTIPIDLYAMLTRGTFPNLGGLRNGDRIFVPPLQDTVAVSGFVRRPGIYELRAGQTRIDAKDLVQLAGGIEIAGRYRLSKTSLESSGGTRLVAVPDAGPAPVADGEVLFVDTENDVALERMSLSGATRLAGTRPLKVASSVRNLIRNPNELACDAYTPFAAIVRRDAVLNGRTIIPFSLVPILSGSGDIPLQNNDLVYIFNRNEIRVLGDVATNQQVALLRPGTLAPAAAYLGTGAPNPTNIPGAIAQPGGVSGTSPDLRAAEGTGAGAYNPQFGLTPGCDDVSLQTPQQQQVYQAGATPRFTGYPNGQYLSSSPQLGPLQQPPGAVQYPGNPQYPGFAQTLNQQYPGVPQYQYPGVPQSQYPGVLPYQYPGVAPYQYTAPQLPGAQPTFGIPGGQQSSQPFVTTRDPQSLSADAIAVRLGIPLEALVRAAADHVIWVLDEVRDPGAYVAGDGTSLADMIETAGGLLRTADLSSVEVTSTQIDALSGTSQTVRTSYKGSMQDFRRVSLQPLDVIRLRPVFSDRQDGRVTLLGQVRYPGTFDITRGERLSSVLERVGGRQEIPVDTRVIAATNADWTALFCSSKIRGR
jgi:protein involved in polysaccharide export with SLBB domain